MLSSRDERVLVGVSAAAGRGLERVARAVLDRDDAVTAAIRAADSTDAFCELVAVLERHHAREWQFSLLDLVTEVARQDRRRRRAASTTLGATSPERAGPGGPCSPPGLTVTGEELT